MKRRSSPPAGNNDLSSELRYIPHARSSGYGRRKSKNEYFDHLKEEIERPYRHKVPQRYKRHSQTSWYGKSDSEKHPRSFVCKNHSEREEDNHFSQLYSSPNNDYRVHRRLEDCECNATYARPRLDNNDQAHRISDSLRKDAAPREPSRIGNNLARELLFTPSDVRGQQKEEQSMHRHETFAREMLDRGIEYMSQISELHRGHGPTTCYSIPSSPIDERETSSSQKYPRSSSLAPQRQWTIQDNLPRPDDHICATVIPTLNDGFQFPVTPAKTTFIDFSSGKAPLYRDEELYEAGTRKLFSEVSQGTSTPIDFLECKDTSGGDAPICGHASDSATGGGTIEIDYRDFD